MNNPDYLRLMGIERWRLRAQGGVMEKQTHAALSIQDVPDSLSLIEAEVRACQRCVLHQSRRHTVFGAGDVEAQWMLVGEAPGAEEDRQGLPFVGRAGQLLNAMLKAVGKSREAVYIANVLKCRPPQNRDPFGIEVQQCEVYLHRQIALIKPSLIIAMGRFAAQSLLRTGDSIGKLRGRCHAYGDDAIPLLVTYHPAYLLRQPLDKKKAWDDLRFALGVCG